MRPRAISSSRVEGSVALAVGVQKAPNPCRRGKRDEVMFTMEAIDLAPRQRAALEKARLHDAASILVLSLVELEGQTGLGAADAQAVLDAVCAATYPIGTAPARALDLLTCDHKTDCGCVQRLTVGCPSLDACLGGGILTRGITEITGGSASGKSQLCIQLCLCAQLPRDLGGLAAGAVYICTEDAFPAKRLSQMAACADKRWGKPATSGGWEANIFVEHASDVAHLYHTVTRRLPVLLTVSNVRLIVIDSITACFRVEYGWGEAVARGEMLCEIVHCLWRLSQQHNASVVVVNQVSDAVDDSDSGLATGSPRVLPALGLLWANLVGTRLLLQRTDRHAPLRLPLLTPPQPESGAAAVITPASSQSGPERFINVMFSPHLPRGRVSYLIDASGVHARLPCS